MWIWYGIILISIERICCSKDYWSGWPRGPWNAYHSHGEMKLLSILNRLHEHMRSYNEEARIRVLDMLYYRFMYEQSPHYELGYLFGEIMERYRKVVASAKLLQKRKSENYFGILKRTELFEIWFIEIYHLVNMMHEIYPKWKGTPEFKTLKGDPMFDLGDLYEAQRLLAYQKQREQRQREKKRKRLIQLQNIIKSGRVVVHKPGSRPKPYNNRYPIDYGWEPETFDELDG